MSSKRSKNFTQCSRCVMDISAPEIVFDDGGVCNFCKAAERELKLTYPNKFFGTHSFGVFVGAQDLQKDNKYNCLIGLSGGVDSSYLLHIALELGYRPLCYTIDNGWNDPKADENIMNLVETLKVPFFRYTIDLEEFRDLQSSFMMAGLKNLEIPTDHILMASALEIAHKNGIKTILSGGNVATESIMPASWGYNARDLVHIKDVYKKMTGKKLKKLPLCGLLKWNWYKWWVGIKTVYLLDYIGYNRSDAEKLLIEKYNFKSTGAKHEESIFTRWFQNFYLFEKFGIDKRKAHLSSMIVSGQITREEAMKIIEENPVYPQLGIEQKVLKYPRREHSDFKQDQWLYNLIARVVKAFQ